MQDTALICLELWGKILQLNKPGDFIIGTGKKTKLKNIIRYVFKKHNLNYKKYIIFDKKFFRENDVMENCANNSQLLKTLKIKKLKKYNYVLDKMITNSLF
jgi:GDP-D-mannose dehydratase